jgi:hypothetical protein
MSDFENALPPFRLATVNHKDTLQKIAYRELGDANRWTELVWINNLIAPYLTGDDEIASDRVLLYGSKIKIPVSSSFNANRDAQVYERDILLRNGRMVDNGAGDVLVVSGTSNLKQQLKNRLNTAIGKLMRHKDYGHSSWSLLGRVNGPIAGMLASQYAKTALLSDYRTSSVKSSSATISGGAVNVTARIVTIAGDEIDIVPGNEEVAQVDDLTEIPVQAPDPLPQVSPVVYRKVVEPSYYDIAKYLGVAPVLNDSPRIMALAQNPSPSSLYFNLQQRVPPAGFAYSDGDFDFSLRFILKTAMTKTTTSLSISGLSASASISVGSAVYVDNEILKVVSYTWGSPLSTLVVKRGCADSVPEVHAVDSVMWNTKASAAGISSVNFANGDNVKARLIPRSVSGQLLPSLAAIDSVDIIDRASRPYPPGNFKIDGISYPDMRAGTITVSWAHRDRTVDPGVLIGTDNNANIGPESDSYYIIRMLRKDTMEEVLFYGLTDTSFEFLGGYTGYVIVELYSVKGSVISAQRHSHEMLYFTTQPRISEDGLYYVTAENEYFRIVE